MGLLRIIFSCLYIILISACSVSYKELSDNAYTPPTKFTKYLMDSYKTKADFEAKEMHDWNSAKLYSEKALAAATGKKIKPEEVLYWKIPKDKVKELQIAYENLMIVYDNAVEKDPYNLAVAISSLDCWAEQQEENWQTWDIERCKDDFLKAMHQIYNKIEIANKEGAQAVSHGATGKGNDQVRFELTYTALEPTVKIIAPWRDWSFRSRGDLIRYAKKHNIPITATKAKPYSMDLNLFHISYEGGILEDPWKSPPESMFQMTVSPERAPNKAQTIEITYDIGDPVAVNGKRMSPAILLAHLNQLGGKHGIGRVDLVENRYVGIKSRGVYETPGGTILHVAHRGIESLPMDREVLHVRDGLIPRYAELVYFGYWFAPERVLLPLMRHKSKSAVRYD